MQPSRLRPWLAGCLVGWMGAWLDGCVAGWVRGWMGAWLDGRVAGCVAGWVPDRLTARLPILEQAHTAPDRSARPCHPAAGPYGTAPATARPPSAGASCAATAAATSASTVVADITAGPIADVPDDSAVALVEARMARPRTLSYIQRRPNRDVSRSRSPPALLLSAGTRPTPRSPPTARGTKE